MSLRTHTILWGAAIIAAALFLQSSGISNAASFGTIAGLTGTAIGALHAAHRQSGGKTS